MYALVAAGPQCDQNIIKDSKKFLKLGEVMFGTIPVSFGLSHIKPPTFNPNSDRDKDFVLVRIEAFSCNYRDKGLLLFNLENYPTSIIPFGSEFSGTVMEVGENVTSFKVGDRVMPESAYPDGPTEGINPGVATNFASKGCLRIHVGKLTKIPDTMDDSTAASFTLGAQTAMGMIRRSRILQGGGRPVVLSSRSATSLFVTRFLISHGFTPFCLTTSDWSSEDLKTIDPAQLLKIDRKNPYTTLVNTTFTHVFDPFVDMNLPLGTEILEMGGTYTTCGFLNQHPELYGESPEELGLGIQSGFKNVIIKNLRIQGNCLGSKSDLDRALKMFEAYKISLPFIHTFTLQNSEDFVKESFFNKQKLGKVVMTMSSS